MVQHLICVMVRAVRICDAFKLSRTVAVELFPHVVVDTYPAHKMPLT